MTIPLTDLAALALGALLCLLLVVGIREARADRRPLPQSRARVGVFLSGVLTFLGAFALPDGGVMAIMAGHILLAFVAPPLLLLGVPRTALLPLFAHRHPRRLLQVLTQPVPAALLFLAVLFLCYLPTLFNATLASDGLRFGVGLAVLAAAIVFWWPVVEPFPAWDRELAGLGKLLYLFVGSSVLKVLGFILALVPRPIYTMPAGSVTLWGLSAINDQQYAGWLMVAAGTFVLLAAATVVCFQLLYDPEEDGDPLPSQQREASDGKLA